MNKRKTYSETKNEPRIVGFVCNWDAYTGIEMAGINNEEYPANITLIRLICLGRLHLGLILKAFELGADGVLLLSCPAGHCKYESEKMVKEVFNKAKKMLRLLGIETKIALIEVPLGRGDILAKQVSAFAERIRGTDSSRIRRQIKAASLA